MRNWFTRKPTPAREPHYTAVRMVPTRGFPAELVGIEQSPAFRRQAEHAQAALRDSSRWPSEEVPIFISLVSPSDDGVVTLPSDEFGGQCLVVFTTPLRANDYVQTHFPKGTAVKYLSSSAVELTRMLRDLRAANVGAFALDRCPRCAQFAMVGSRSADTPQDLLTLWSMTKASTATRADYCVDYAASAAKAGALNKARDVLLEAVAHVTPDDGRIHFLLGQIAVALHEDRLLQEVRAYFRHLDFALLERRLERSVASGQPDFGL